MSFSLIKNERALFNMKGVNNLIVPLKSGLGRQGSNRPRRGAVMFNKNDNSFYGYNGTAWNPLSVLTETVTGQAFTVNSVSTPDLTYVRVGSTVYVTISTEILGSGAGPIPTAAGAIPANFRPTADRPVNYVASDNSVNPVPGSSGETVTFGSNGTITVSGTAGISAVAPQILSYQI